MFAPLLSLAQILLLLSWICVVVGDIVPIIPRQNTNQPNINFYFHVVSAGGTEQQGNISDTGLSMLFDYFEYWFGTVNVTVTLVNTSRTVNSVWAASGTVENSTDSLAMKAALRTGGYDDINVYFINASYSESCTPPFSDPTADAIAWDGCIFDTERLLLWEEGENSDPIWQIWALTLLDWFCMRVTDYDSCPCLNTGVEWNSNLRMVPAVDTAASVNSTGVVATFDPEEPISIQQSELAQELCYMVTASDAAGCSSGTIWLAPPPSAGKMCLDVTFANSTTQSYCTADGNVGGQATGVNSDIARRAYLSALLKSMIASYRVECYMEAACSRPALPSSNLRARSAYAPRMGAMSKRTLSNPIWC